MAPVTPPVPAAPQPPRSRRARPPMLMASVLAVLLAKSAMGQAPPADAQPTPPQDAAAGASNPAVALLLGQAEFWKGQNDAQRAMQALDKALQIDPGNLDAILAAAENAAQFDRPDATAYLDRARRAAPGDARLRAIEAIARQPRLDLAALAAARRAAQAGRNAEAVGLYRSLFHNDQPPASIVVEYYEVLSGTSEQGYAEARRELGRLAERLPNDGRTQMAYAQILTYREETRIDGIERLQRMVQSRAMPGAAVKWRQALLFLGADPTTVDLIEAYLQSNPSDPEIATKLREARGSLISAGVTARMVGWSSLERNKAEAERQFQIAMTEDPDDAEAVTGLAVVRKMQGRMPEAQRLLNRAIEMSPERRTDFIEAVGAGPDAMIRSQAATGAARGPVSSVVLAWRALNRGDLDRADEFGRKATRQSGAERLQGEVVLGQVALLRQDYVTAELRFRNALALRPRLPEALRGLYEVLQRQSRFAEAEALQQETGFSPPSSSASSRAYALRETAFREENPDRRLQILREALTADPGNVWVRFDLARLLQAAGERAEAQGLERQLAQETGPEALGAAALLAADDDRPGDAAMLLERVPVRLRTGDMNRLLTRTRREAEIRTLEAQLRAGLPEARQRLLAQAGSRDPSGSTGAAVVRAFGRLGDAAGVMAAAQAVLAANPTAEPNLRLMLAGSLVAAGQQPAAEVVVAPLAQSTTLTAEERRQLLALQATGIIARSDRLNEAGDQGAAYRELQRALQQEPNSPQLNLALARVYLGAGRTADARRIVDAILARDMRNRDARLTLIDIALTQRDTALADALIAEGKALHPGDVQLVLAEARVARLRGDSLRALRLLEASTRQRIQELRAHGALEQAALATDLLSPQRALSRAGQEPVDAVSAELVRDLLRARDEAATWLQAGLGVRGHSGEGGLSRLTEVTAPVELSMPVAGIGGRVGLQASAVSLMSSAVSRDVQARQFGTGPLNGAGSGSTTDSTTTGLALGIGYTNRAVRLDAGSTPLGFQQTNLVGGAEVALPLGANLRLRVAGERRAVAESVLAYAGQRDLATGRNWGGVIRSGGRAQLEYAANDKLGFYAGGGWSVLQGTNVASNQRVELGGGSYYSLLRTPDEEFSVGADLRYFHFDRNLRYFTFGQGGYFSPQSHVLGTVQADWRKQWGDLTTRLQAVAGWQRFREHSSPAFPNDPGLQSSAERLAAADPTATASYRAQSSSGLTGGIRANVEYALSPTLRIGAAGRFDRTGNYSDSAGLVYLRWRLDQPHQDIAPLLASAPTRYPAQSWPMPSALVNGSPELVQLQPGASRPVW